MKDTYVMLIGLLVAFSAAGSAQAQGVILKQMNQVPVGTPPPNTDAIPEGAVRLTAEQIYERDNRKHQLPAYVKHYLKVTNFNPPTFHNLPLVKKDFGPDIPDMFKYGPEYYEPETEIIADFDGDNRQDYALMIQTRPGNASIVVLLDRKSGFTHQVIRTFEYTQARGIPIVMYLMKEKFETYDENGQAFWRPAIYIGLAGEHYFEAWFYDGYKFMYYKNGH
jgi:hypothetical protein